MIVSAEQVGGVLLRNWDALGGGTDRPSDFSFVLVTKGREAVGKLVLLAFPDHERSPRFAIKLARLPEQDAALQAEYGNLRFLGSRASHGRVHAPKALLCEQVTGSLMLVESVVDGTELSYVAGARAGLFVEPVVDWLIHLGLSTAGKRPPDGCSVEDVSALLSRAGRHAGGEAERRTLERLSDELSGLDDRPLPRVFEQRDMGTWNLMVAADGSIGVVDWESSTADGFPLWDLFYFLAHHAFMVHRSGARGDEVRTYTETFFGHDRFARTCGTAIRRYAAALGVGPALLPALLAGCWLHHAVSEATRLGIPLSESLFWKMLVATLDRRDRQACWN